MIVEAEIDLESMAQTWPDLARDLDPSEWRELDTIGDMIVRHSPLSDAHQQAVFHLTAALNRALGPEALPDVRLATDRGIFLPALVWMPAARWGRTGSVTPLPFVPDICVELLDTEGARSRVEPMLGACFRGGAREVILVGPRGGVEYHGPDGRRERSAYGLNLILPL